MSVSFDVCCGPDVIVDALAQFASGGGDERSLAYLKEPHVTEEAGLDRQLVATEEKRADPERRIREFEHKTNTVN